MPVESGALIKKLDKTCLDALQAAAGLCLSRTNYSVEIEHWLLKLVEAPNTDLTRIFRQFEVDTSKLLRDLTRAIDGFKTGNARTPSSGTPRSTSSSAKRGSCVPAVPGPVGPLRGAAAGPSGRPDPRSAGPRNLAPSWPRSARPRSNLELAKIDRRLSRGRGPGRLTKPETRCRQSLHRPRRQTPALDQYTVNLTAAGPRRARSTPSSAATPRSARWSTS